MGPMKGFFACGLLTVLLAMGGCKEPWDVLSPEERATVDSLLRHWESWVPERKKEGTAPLITFEELYAGLSAEQRTFLESVRAIDPRKSFDFQGKYLGNPAEGVRFRRIEGQWITRGGERRPLNPQYLPENVYQAYERMMAAMEKDIGKRLFVDSGYRSPAYQLYNFLYYLPKHAYSLVETGHWVALPGYSEHGAPHRQAIDFVSGEGRDSDATPEEFEQLQEYRWLLEHAQGYGFILSYPRGQKGVTFEPWHWHYEKPRADG
jgi:LAS superfamily LD-carboxypeptidase LdcB